MGDKLIYVCVFFEWLWRKNGSRLNLLTCDKRKGGGKNEKHTTHYQPLNKLTRIVAGILIATCRQRTHFKSNTAKGSTLFDDFR